MTTRIVLICSLISLVGCIGPLKRKHEEPIKALAKEYRTFQGIKAAAAVLQDGNKELEVFLGVGEREKGQEYPNIEPDEPFADVLYCKAYNEEKKPLIEIARLMNSSNNAVFLYGKLVKDKYKQYYSGLDCVFYAVGVWHPDARRYVTIDAVYGISWRDYFSWRTFIKQVVSHGTKAGIKAAPLP